MTASARRVGHRREISCRYQASWSRRRGSFGSFEGDAHGFYLAFQVGHSSFRGTPIFDDALIRLTLFARYISEDQQDAWLAANMIPAKSALIFLTQKTPKKAENAEILPHQQSAGSHERDRARASSYPGPSGTGWVGLGIALTANLNPFPEALAAGRFTMTLEGCLPGVMRPEKPARGALDAPAAAGITNHSTLTLNDDFSAPVVFEFVSSGVVTPGNGEIDISAAVTAQDVASAIVLAVATWVGAQAIPAFGDGRGFLVETEGDGIVKLVQAFPHKEERGSTQPYAFTWISKTSGAFGNNAIVPSIAGEWTGRIRGMMGGKARRAGTVARPVAGPSRAQALNAFYPLLEVPPPDLG